MRCGRGLREHRSTFYTPPGTRASALIQRLLVVPGQCLFLLTGNVHYKHKIRLVQLTFIRIIGRHKLRRVFD
jgi:hypothetical protein